MLDDRAIDILFLSGIDFCLLKCPGQLGVLRNLLFNGYWGTLYSVEVRQLVHDNDHSPPCNVEVGFSVSLRLLQVKWDNYILCLCMYV
jgi:hypothetical protein